MKLPQYSNGCRSARSLITASRSAEYLRPPPSPAPQTFNFLDHSLSLCATTVFRRDDDSRRATRFNKPADGRERDRGKDLNPFVQLMGLFVCVHDETRNSYQTDPIRFHAWLKQVDVIRIIGENYVSVSDQREIFISGLPFVDAFHQRDTLLRK